MNSVVRLHEFDRPVRPADVEQFVTVPALGANEMQAVGIDFRIDFFEVQFSVAAAAFPHGIAPCLLKESWHELNSLTRRGRASTLRAAGWSSLAARRAHNPKVVGSNPTPATKAQ